MVPTPLIQHIIHKRNRMNDKMTPKDIRPSKKRSNYGSYMKDTESINIGYYSIYSMDNPDLLFIT